MKSILNRGDKKFPEYFFKWEDFIDFKNNPHIERIFKEDNIENVLSPLVSGYIKGVHRNTDQKISLIKKDVLKAYMRLIIYDMITQGKVIKLPANWGWMTIVSIETKRKDKRKRGIFYVIQTEELNRRSKNPKKNFTKVHIRDIQLLRQITAMVNHFPNKYHTIDTFNDYVNNDINYYKNLMTI